MAAVDGFVALFHATLRDLGTGEVRRFDGLCDEALWSENYVRKRTSLTVGLAGPIDALPAKDALAVQMALAVLAGDMVAAHALADHLIDHHNAAGMQ